MIQASVMFGGVISKVSLARCPFDFKLALLTSFFDSVGAHISRLCSFLFHDACEDVLGRLVIDSNSGGWLWVPHVFKSWGSVIVGYGLSRRRRCCVMFSLIRVGVHAAHCRT